MDILNKLLTFCGIVLSFGLAFTPAPVWAQFTQDIMIQASDTKAHAHFGHSVSISGDRAIVGIHQHYPTNSDTGAVYIFERNGSGTWNEVARLQASDKHPRDYFGISVSISGDRAIVGGHSSMQDGRFIGAAYIFERNGSGTWNEVVKLQSGGVAFDNFGHSVSISGDRAIVGAHRDNTGGSDDGAAFIYERNSSGRWNQAMKVQASDKQAQDYFGISVSISGDRAIVGAQGEDDGGTNTGAAYIFGRTASGSWKEVLKLQTREGNHNGDNFGHSVSISGNRAIVGAYFEGANGSNMGTAYIYEDGVMGIWTETAKLQASDKATGDYFGHSVSISGDQAIVGANKKNIVGANSINHAGAAYIFERDEYGVWNEQTKILASENARMDHFGGAVAVGDNYAIVGAEGKSTGGTAAGINAGAIYIFNKQD